MICLAEEVSPTELREERLHKALLARCRADRIEPAAPSRVDRVLSTGWRSYGPAAAGCSRAEGRPRPAGPGNAAHRDRQAGAGALGLPAMLFAAASEKLVAA
jgi:hypothetical protein